MIKFAAHNKDGRRLLGFGLSRLNLQNLMRENPIFVFGEELGLAGYEIMIFFGETEEKMLADLKRAGIITDAEGTTKQ